MKRIRTIVSRYENFFKHADRDPDSLLDFNPEATEVFILDAVVTYESLTQEIAPILSTFKAWIFLQEPQFMNEKDRQRLIEKSGGGGIEFGKIPKAEFFMQYHSILMKLGIFAT